MTLRIERPIPRRGLALRPRCTWEFPHRNSMNCRIGPAKILDGRKLYAIELLDEFFDALPAEGDDAVADWTVRL
jgi:hypothetical protein